MSDFVAQHRDSWDRLTQLLRQADTEGLRCFSPAQLDDLARLYRQAVSHLARARTNQEPLEVIAYLNDLVARAHGRIYATRRRRSLNLHTFFLRTFPQTFRRTIWFSVLSATLFYGTAGAAFLAVRGDPTAASALFDESFTRYLDNFMADKDAAAKYFGERMKGASAAALSSFLMTNNIKATLMTFAGGATAGVFTLFSLLQNALMLGTFLGLAANHGDPVGFLAILVPHGVMELTAICLGGAGGLRMAYALLDPGDLRRHEAFVRGAREAVVLALGTIPLLVVAAIIESVVGPSHLDWTARFLIAGIAAVTVVWYLFVAGRGGSDER